MLPSGGTGARLGQIAIVLAGISALSATLVTIVSVWLQTKNYRKPLLQRYVVRILLMVPIYCAASWASLVSVKVSFWIEPFRDVYEAFTIYAFFQLLINFIGGERALIIMMHGRQPVNHLWPLNHCLAKVDISDPHTFLAVKRGILQYTWVKPMLAVATVVMKATGTYKEGYIGVTSGYLWSGIIYNISITVSLYALALFWICMSVDLKPFRPMPKFLCIKGIIFASYWQGFFLSILVWLGAIPDNVSGYTADNLAAAIQDALICFEMPLFALLHWYAFSWHDYADVTISAARMPVKFALRDAFGPRDLIEDAKETFAGKKYDYRYFDAGDDMLAHEDSAQRVARLREGMRFERNGKGKYWLPKPGKADSKTPLLRNEDDMDERPPSSERYGAVGDAFTEPDMNKEDERLYGKAKELEFGDWNYPVITAHNASREDGLYRTPGMITASTNRNVFQPTNDNRKRRKSRIASIQQDVDKGKHRKSSSSGHKSRSGVLKTLGLTKESSSGSDASGKSDRSQLVDLVVEDDEAGDIERVRARKEGSPEWNRHEAKHFVRTYPDSSQGEVIREGHEPSSAVNKEASHLHTLNSEYVLDDDEDEASEEASQWQERDYGATDNGGEADDDAAHDVEETNVWASPKH